MRKYHIDWGYDLWERDKPHFQNNVTDLVELNNPNMKYIDRAKKYENPFFDKIE
jgi:hypothetical protein